MPIILLLSVAYNALNSPYNNNATLMLYSPLRSASQHPYNASSILLLPAMLLHISAAYNGPNGP